MRRVGFARSLFALGVGAAALLTAAVPSSAQDLVRVRVAAPPSEDTAPILYAINAGLFAKAGLKVEFAQMSSGSVISAAVAGGATDIGFSSLTGLISGHVRGIPFQLIAPGGNYTADDPYAFMFVRKDSTIRSARDFAGKTIASPALKDLDWIASSAWIDQHGGNSKSSSYIELSNPTLLPALLDGRVDSYTVGQPWAETALDSGKVRVIAKSFESISPHFLMTAWFSTSDYVTKNRDAVDKFNRVIHDAATYTNAHRAEIIPLLANVTKLEPGLIARTIKPTGNLYLDPRDIQPMIDVSAKYHVIEKGFNAQDLISPAALKPGR